MLIAEHTTLKLQLQLLDTLAAIVHDVDVGQEVRAAYPDLTMKSSRDIDRLAMSQEARFCHCQRAR